MGRAILDKQKPFSTLSSIMPKSFGIFFVVGVILAGMYSLTHLDLVPVKFQTFMGAGIETIIGTLMCITGVTWLQEYKSIPKIVGVCILLIASIMNIFNIIALIKEFILQ